MKSKSVFQIAIVLILMMGACSKKTFEGAGMYKGMAMDDGKEMVTVLSLQPDLTYVMQTASTDIGGQVTESRGSFSWSRDNIVLKDSQTGSKTMFKANENILQESGKMVPLFKTQPDCITEKYWKLVELNGKPVVLDESFKREPFFILRTEEHRVNGNGGCNTLTGSYEIDAAAKRIKFSQMATSMMMCLNMEVENAMKKVFEVADNYSLSPDGKYLSLNRARMAPLARFEVVYLR